MNSDIKILFDKHNGYIKKQDIPDRKTYLQLLKMMESGKVVRLKRGVYCYHSKMSNVMIDVDKIVPNGVLCMFSAWFCYQLSVQIPQSFNIAIEKNRKAVLPDYPPITLCYWQHEYYELGIVRQEINGYTVNIYDLEKSVCDAVKYRTKIGIDVCSEILKNYLKRRDRDISKLIEYAKRMRVEKILKTYLDIQL
jgi:predicted transcriptional regulator of viral defense system